MKWFGAAALSYYLSLRFVFPGYFHPLSPHHDDFYFPPGLGFDGRSLWQHLHWPRPLGFLAAEVMGKLGLHGYLLVLVILAILNAALTVSLVRRMVGRPASWVAAAAYFAFLFTQPDFYVDYLHDSWATLSYFYLILAMHAWYKYRESERLRYGIASAALMLAIAFTKETYFVAALWFWLAEGLLCRGKQRRASLALAAVSMTFFAAGLAFNAWSIRTLVPVRTDAASPYHVSLALPSVARGFYFYASRLFHPAVLLLIVASFAAIRKRRKEAAAALTLFGAGLAALLPHAVLPNHLDHMYAWTGALLAFAPVLFVPVEFRHRTARRAAAASVALTALLILTVRTSQARYAEHRWTIAQEQINRRIIEAYPALRRVQGKRILIAGLGMPFQPFHTGSYIRAEFGPGRSWTLVIPREAVEKSDAPVDSRRPQNVRLADYDQAFGFDDSGRLLREWNRGQLLQALAGGQADRVLLPALNPALDELAKTPESWHALLRAGAIYWQWGELDKAADYLQRSAKLDGARNPYPMFFLGRVREAQSKIEEARRCYERAIALDTQPPNPAFRQALEKLGVK